MVNPLVEVLDKTLFALRPFPLSHLLRAGAEL